MTPEQARLLILSAVNPLLGTEEENIVEVVCESKESYQTLIDAMRTEEISNLLNSHNVKLHLKIKSSHPPSSDIERIGLVAASIELSHCTSYDSMRWLQRLVTFGYNTVMESERAELKTTMLSMFPVELLPDDELMDICMNRANLEDQLAEQRLEELSSFPGISSELEELKSIAKALKGKEPISLNLTPYDAFVLTGILQLAFRHPVLRKGEGYGDNARFFTQKLIDEICDRAPEARGYLDRGWHPEFDN